MFCSQDGRATYAQISWLRQLPSSSSGSPHSEREEGEVAMMVEEALSSRTSAILYLLESSRTSGQGTLVKCWVPFPGQSPPGESGECIPARGLRQDGELPYEDHPLLGLVGQDSCCSKDPRLLPLKAKLLRLPSAQDRRCTLGLLWLGLGGLSARFEEKDLRTVWEFPGGAEGDEALELRIIGKEEVG